MKEVFDNISKYVISKSYFFDKDIEDDTLYFTTRENGSVYHETPSQIDINEAKRLKSEILNKFKGIEVFVYTVDEWVYLKVKEFKEKKEIFKYIFKKDMNGCGFSHGFNSMDELINEYGNWIVIDWNKIKEDVEKINEFKDNTFCGSYNSEPFLIKKAGEEGNDWGYNFYIIKNRRIE